MSGNVRWAARQAAGQAAGQAVGQAVGQAAHSGDRAGSNPVDQSVESIGSAAGRGRTGQDVGRTWGEREGGRAATLPPLCPHPGQDGGAVSRPNL